MSPSTPARAAAFILLLAWGSGTAQERRPYLTRTALRTLGGADLCARGRMLARTGGSRGQFDLARFQLLEILVGECAEAEIRVLAGSGGYFADVREECLLFLRKGAPGMPFRAVGKIALGDPAADRRCAFLKDLYHREREPDRDRRIRGVFSFLVGGLRSPTAWVREVSAAELAALVPEHPLHLTLSQEEDLRAAVKGGLPVRAAEALRAALAGLGDEEARRARALAEIGDRLRPGRAARDRAQAVEEAGRLLGDAAVPILEGALHDPDPGVRAAAAEALAGLGAKRAAEKLLARLGEETDPGAIGKTVDALGLLRYLPATPALRRLSGEPGLGARAVLALRRIGGEENLAFLRELRRRARAREGRDAERERMLDFVLSPEFEVQERALETLRAERR